MDDAALFFLEDTLYKTTLEFTLEEGQDLRIGIRKSMATAGDWTIFDNYRLDYLGLPPVSYDVNGDGRVSIADVATLVSIILGNNIGIRADMDGDGSVTSADVTVLLDIIMGQTEP